MEKTAPRIRRWPADQRAGPDQIEARMRSENLPFYRWSNGPGDVYGAHEHTYDKIIYVLEGEITFGLPGLKREVCLKTGDRLNLPAGIVHNAVVGDRGVVCLEAHRQA